MNKCKICGNNINNNIYYVKNLYFDEKFEYFQCNRCECLQLKDIPNDLSKYYPDNYYSFVPESKNILEAFLKKIFSNANIYYYSKKGNLISRLMCILFSESLPPIIPKENIYEVRLLDVGCGYGKLLKELAESGFKYLYGIDPFIKQNIIINYSDIVKIQILKKEIYDINNKYDIIMMNHSLEHMPEQEKVLNKIYDLLEDNGELIIRIPTVTSYNWEKYKEFWFELGAPAHIFLHSVKSLSILLKNCGFIITNIVYDSTSGTIASKLCKKGYNANKIYKVLFSPFGIILLFYHRIISKMLNKNNKGSSIRVYIKKESKKN